MSRDWSEAVANSVREGGKARCGLPATKVAPTSLKADSLGARSL